MEEKSQQILVEDIKVLLQFKTNYKIFSPEGQMVAILGYAVT